jgi:hypothetical protein
MLVIEELRKTFFGAEILFRMFSHAQELLKSRKESAGNNASTPKDQEANQTGGPTLSRSMGSANEAPMAPMDDLLVSWNFMFDEMVDPFFFGGQVT